MELTFFYFMSVVYSHVQKMQERFILLREDVWVYQTG